MQTRDLHPISATPRHTPALAPTAPGSPHAPRAPNPLPRLTAPAAVPIRADADEPHRVGERVKRMVGRVLTGNGITELLKGHYRLIGSEELSDSERDELLLLCRMRLDAIRAQRGEEVFARRPRHRTPISGSIKVRVLTRAKGPLRMLRRRLLLGKPRSNGPWRWTPSCPGTRAARTTSATCRPCASAAMPASAKAVCLRKRSHRLPRPAGQLRPSPGRFCVLRAGGQRPGAAGERTGAVHRRCLSGDALAAAW